MTAEEYAEIRQKHAEEMRERISGEKNPMYGKYGDLNPNFGRPHTEEEKKRMRAYQSNRTPEHKKKLKENHADYNGENNPNYRKPMSKEQKEKISKARVGRFNGFDHVNSIHVKCIETREIFGSISLAM